MRVVKRKLRTDNFIARKVNDGPSKLLHCALERLQLGIIALRIEYSMPNLERKVHSSMHFQRECKCDRTRMHTHLVKCSSRSTWQREKIRDKGQQRATQIERQTQSHRHVVTQVTRGEAQIYTSWMTMRENVDTERDNLIFVFFFFFFKHTTFSGVMRGVMYVVTAVFNTCLWQLGG